MGYSKVWWAITCTKHGMQEKGNNVRWVRVSPPKGKEDRKTRGCPACKRIARDDNRLQ